jgi:hypothetical protein
MKRFARTAWGQWRDDAGFTLIEAVIAAGLMLAASVVVLTVQTQTTTWWATANARTVATDTARSVLANTLSRNYGDVVLESGANPIHAHTTTSTIVGVASIDTSIVDVPPAAGDPVQRPLRRVTVTASVRDQVVSVSGYSTGWEQVAGPAGASGGKYMVEVYVVIGGGTVLTTPYAYHAAGTAWAGYRNPNYIQQGTTVQLRDANDFNKVVAETYEDAYGFAWFTVKEGSYYLTIPPLVPAQQKALYFPVLITPWHQGSDKNPVLAPREYFIATSMTGWASGSANNMVKVGVSSSDGYPVGTAWKSAKDPDDTLYDQNYGQKNAAGIYYGQAHGGMPNVHVYMKPVFVTGDPLKPTYPDPKYFTGPGNPWYAGVQGNSFATGTKPQTDGWTDINGQVDLTIPYGNAPNDGSYYRVWFDTVDNTTNPPTPHHYEYTFRWDGNGTGGPGPNPSPYACWSGYVGWWNANWTNGIYNLDGYYINVPFKYVVGTPVDKGYQ